MTDNQSDKPPEFLSTFSTDKTPKSITPKDEPLDNLIRSASKFNSSISPNSAPAILSLQDKIKSILKQHGMDSQQQEKALAQIFDAINDSNIK